MKKNIRITRVFPAPVESVWEIWTVPELVKMWWGPDRFTCPSAVIDFRVGGRSLVAMRAAKEMGGKEWFSIWTYTNIVPMTRIEFIQNLADSAGNKIDPSLAGMPPDFPTDIYTEVLFEKMGDGKTKMALTEYADMGQTTEFAKMGLAQSGDKMVSIFK